MLLQSSDLGVSRRPGSLEILLHEFICYVNPVGAPSTEPGRDEFLSIGALTGARAILVQAESVYSLTRLLAWDYGERFEWQRVAAGWSLFSTLPCGDVDWDGSIEPCSSRETVDVFVPHFLLWNEGE
jgi:hypothetical protein